MDVVSIAFSYFCFLTGPEILIGLLSFSFYGKIRLQVMFFASIKDLLLFLLGSLAKSRTP